MFQSLERSPVLPGPINQQVHGHIFVSKQVRQFFNPGIKLFLMTVRIYKDKLMFINNDIIPFSGLY